MSLISNQDIPLIVIAGPTGVGKTDLSIELAQQVKGQIINGDSMQIYQGLDIGTGKVQPQEMQGIPHHLLDIIEVHETYNASQFKQVAQQAIRDIHQQGDVPILVGGTGLYLEGLLYQLDFGYDNSHDPEVRHKYERMIVDQGNQPVWDYLNEIDPKAANKIPVNNSRRIIRALEMIEVTGQLFSSQTSHEDQQSIYKECFIVLDRPRQELYQRINSRVLEMVDKGLEEEAFNLFRLDPDLTYQSSKGIGYKEWWPYFKGQTSIGQVIEQIQQNSRRYAKRQLTWFRNRIKRKHWIEINDSRQLTKQVLSILQEDYDF